MADYNDITAERAAKKARSMELSRALTDSFLSGSPALCKEAADQTGAFTRTKLTENSFAHKILPAEDLQPSELTEDINERKPYKIVPLEPNSRGAVTVQFGTPANSMFFDSQYYRVNFNRIVSPRLSMDTVELMRYRYDIREVLIDQQTKFIEMEKDRKFLDGTHYALSMTETMGALGNGLKTPSQMRRFASGLTREAFVDSIQIMQSTNAHVPPACALCNTKTYNEFAKWTDHDMGGDTIAEDIIMNGIGERSFMGLNWIVSIKHELIPDGMIYYFATPDFLGKHYVLEDLTLWVKHEAFTLTTFQWTCAGAAIGNISGLALADFNPYGLSDGGTPISFGN